MEESNFYAVSQFLLENVKRLSLIMKTDVHIGGLSSVPFHASIQYLEVIWKLFSILKISFTMLYPNIFLRVQVKNTGTVQHNLINEYVEYMYSTAKSKALNNLCSYQYQH